MAEGTSFALVQPCGLATAFQTGTLLDSVNSPWGTAGILTLLGADRQAALFDLLERTKRISPLSQPWESRMLLMTPCAHLIRRAWLPRRDSRPQRRANRARILNVELRGSKWHPRRISRPIGPT